MSENRLSVYELTQGAAMMLARGSEGFDTDEELVAWQKECEEWMALSGDKFVACKIVMSRADAEEEWLKAEAAKLLERAKRFATVRERVKGLATELMKSQIAMGAEPKIQMADGSSISLVKRAEIKVIVDDLDEVPTEYTRVKVEADLPAIKAAHKVGREVPGVTCADIESYSLRFSK